MATSGARAANGNAASAETPREQPRRRLRVVTRCATIEEFLIAFAPLADETSVFVLTSVPRPLGVRQSFVLELRDGTPMLRGEAEVVESIRDLDAPVRGMRLRLLSMDDGSRAVHRQLLARTGLAPYEDPTSPGRVADEATSTEVLQRLATAAPQQAPATQRPVSPPASHRFAQGPASAPAPESRAPGSALQLPANPFEELSSEVLEAFVDCTLFDNQGAMPDRRTSLPGSQASLPAGLAPREDAAAVEGGRDGRRQAWLRITQPQRWALLFAGTALVSVLTTLAFSYWLWGGSPASTASTASEAAPMTTTAAAVAPSAVPRQPEVPVVTPVVTPVGRCAATVRSEPMGAVVRWNGELLGNTPLMAVTVPCGAATVVVEHPQRLSVEHTVKPSLGRPVFLFDKLRRPTVELKVTSDPPNAKIIAAGRQAGRSPTSIVVGAHDEIEVVATLGGYRPRVIKLVPAPPSATAHLELEPVAGRLPKR